MRGSIRAVLAATVVLLGFGQSPADASALPTPGLGAVVCDGFTGMCTNPVFVRDVVFYADQFSPVPGDSPILQRWSLGRVKVAESDLLSAGASRCSPWATSGSDRSRRASLASRRWRSAGSSRATIRSTHICFKGSR